MPFYNYNLRANVAAARFASAGISQVQSWSPQSRMDMPIPWPRTWIERYRQNYNPFTFARNAGIIRGHVGAQGWIPLYREVMAYMDETARNYTRELANGDLQIFYDFAIRPHGTIYPQGHGGAFGTALTALGYLHLHLTAENAEYLERAERLLDGALNPNAEDRGWSVDKKGYLWLEEVQSREQNLGVFNGHVIAIIAYYEFREATGTRKYDDLLRAAITTMAHWLPLQMRPQGFFCYNRDNLDFRDYGQERAVLLAEFLAFLTGDPALCGISKIFRQSFEVWNRDAGD